LVTKDYTVQVSCSIVDWSEVTHRHAAGTLEDDLMDIEVDEEWFRSADALGDSAMQFFEAGRIYQALATHLSADNRAHGDASLGLVLGEELVDDLEAEMECWFRIISPERVSRIASEFQRFDCSELAELYEKHCPAEDREYSSNFDEFKEYVDQWKAAFAEAAAEGRGIFCNCG
jgi:hypothetical protein